MRLTFYPSLLKRSSFRVPARANRLLELRSLLDFEQLGHYLDSDCSLYILGEGTNTLFLDKVPGSIIRPCFKGIDVLVEAKDFVEVEVAAAENWDEFVQFCLLKGWYGLENLSYIPGSVGAAPVQNIGAYGVEVGQHIVACKGYNINTQQMETLDNTCCQFDYRHSLFKGSLKNSFIITSVVFRLSKLFRPEIGYQGLEAQVNEMSVRGFDAMILRQAVFTIRNKKLPDPSILPNGGSFFKNPVISQQQYSRLKTEFLEVPVFPANNGVKIPAAWLIEQCGFKGYLMNGCRVHRSQPLVIVNEGRAKGSDIKALATKVKSGVFQKLGIELHYEVNIIGY